VTGHQHNIQPVQYLTPAVFKDFKYHQLTNYNSSLLNCILRLTCFVLFVKLHLSEMVGCVAQLAERWSSAGELTLSCARPAAGV